MGQMGQVGQVVAPSRSPPQGERLASHWGRFLHKLPLIDRKLPGRTTGTSGTGGSPLSFSPSRGEAGCANKSYESDESHESHD